VVLGGNHDSVAVLKESAELLRCLNTTVVPGYVSDPSQHLLVLKNREGVPAAVLAAVPFLRPRDLSQRDDFRSSAGVEAGEKQLQLQQQISVVYQELYQAAQTLASELSPDTPLPLVATGHLTTVGASSSESVREIYIGTLDAFAASGFPPFAYIALGHIHQAQKVGGTEHIRYSGSPLALSFDEARQQKYCLEVTLNVADVTVEALPLPCFQPLLSLKSDLASLPALLAPALQHLSEGQRLWLELVLTGDSALLSDVQIQLEQLLAALPIDLLRLRRQRPTDVATIADSGLSLQELTPADVFTARLVQEDITPELQTRLQQLHQEALALLQQAELVVSTTGESV